jgi:hypothetical protein
MIVVGVGAVKPLRWMREAVTTISPIASSTATGTDCADWLGAAS